MIDWRTISDERASNQFQFEYSKLEPDEKAIIRDEMTEYLREYAEIDRLGYPVTVKKEKPVPLVKKQRRPRRTY